MNGEIAEQFSEILTNLLKEDNSEYFYGSYEECIEAINSRGNKE